MAPEPNARRPVSIPSKTLEQLRRFAEEVMPAFRKAEVATALVK